MRVYWKAAARKPGTLSACSDLTLHPVPAPAQSIYIRDSAQRFYTRDSAQSVYTRDSAQSICTCERARGIAQLSAIMFTNRRV